MPDAQAKALMESLHERAAIARGEKTGTALGDAIHFERAAAEIDRLTKELEEAREFSALVRDYLSERDSPVPDHAMRRSLLHRIRVALSLQEG